ncbi:MAG TPA: hypothetical protein DCS87_12265 [Rheinheimera sp.]|nr:hypothetical protein [Rheinheimera sp.]
MCEELFVKYFAIRLYKKNRCGGFFFADDLRASWLAHGCGITQCMRRGVGLVLYTEKSLVKSVCSLLESRHPDV